MNINSLVLNIASYFISSARARCIVQPTPQACINKASCKLHRSDTKQHVASFSPVVTLEACYLVKWRLDSCTSISLLLKSLSSFRIAACKGEKKKKNKREIWEKRQRLSTPSAASEPVRLPPFGMLHASFRLILRPWMILLNYFPTSQEPSISSSRNPNAWAIIYKLLLLYQGSRLLSLTIIKKSVPYLYSVNATIQIIMNVIFLL